MANPCKTCKYDTFLGCGLMGTRSGIETLARREAEKGAPNPDLNHRIVALCRTLEAMCEDYRTDVESYDISLELQTGMSVD